METIDSNKQSISLSIIIVNYNGKTFLHDCLESIRANVDCDCSYEIIVVDNASTDGSVEYINKNYADVRLIVSDINLGFTGGNNLGALNARGSYLLLLNNDTVLQSSVNPMLNVMETHKSVGVVGCRLHYENGELQESIGLEHTPLSLFFSWTGLGNLFKLNIARRTVHKSDPLYSASLANGLSWVSGACFLTRKEIWDHLNGFDDSYFMYVEDVDYCKRVRLCGYSVAYTNDVTITHYEGGARPWIGQRALLNTVRSYQIYVRKYYGYSGLIILRILLIPLFVARCLGFFCIALFKKRRVCIEKAIASLLAAWMLLSVGLPVVAGKMR